MTMNTLFIISALVSVVACSSQNSYSIPQPQIEVFQPKGLRVSIPDSWGVQAFSFHAKLNKPLLYKELGDITKEVYGKENGRWVFEDKNMEIKEGDILYYWIYVRRGYLGYIRDNQIYIVKELLNTTTDSITSNALPTESTPTTEMPTASVQKYVENNILVWRDLIVKTIDENKKLSDELDKQKLAKDLMLAKLKTINNADVNSLRLQGFSPIDDNPIIFVNTFIRNKLNIYNVNVSKASWNADNSITFEADNIDDKVLLYVTAAQKLKNSLFSITDA